LLLRNVIAALTRGISAGKRRRPSSRFRVPLDWKWRLFHRTVGRPPWSRRKIGAGDGMTAD